MTENKKVTKNQPVEYQPQVFEENPDKVTEKGSTASLP